MPLRFVTLVGSGWSLRAVASRSLRQATTNLFKDSQPPTNFARLTRLRALADILQLRYCGASFRFPTCSSPLSSSMVLFVGHLPAQNRLHIAHRILFRSLLGSS
ncbi:hypothetical protein SCHPADRAFT_516375 [Schizopora paradoxa]|uniref:Uncharacterized protein n=1 Tax=Schizopora paradoxa TaxID=27342 RepID=A0A0H2RF41_9AGAM|nr:hypothetical protein SCHPADRAFT_516375 [Schizopora paradoxa]